MSNSAMKSGEMPFLDPEDEAMARNDSKVGAMAVVINPEGMILHLRDDKEWIPHPGCWSLFGGGVEPRESPHETVVRELQEELGIKDPILRPLCRLIDIGGDGRILFIFEAKTPMLSCDMTLAEGQAFKSFNVNEALNLNLAPFCRRILARFYLPES